MDQGARVARAGSYQVETFAIGLDHEIRRLNAQVDLFWSSESLALERAGLTGDMDVLDCGCGPGRLIELLKTAHPNLRLTGVEIDPVLVEAATKRLRDEGHDCTIVQGSAEQPNLPQGSFDFIVMRLVLEHVVDPVLALKSLKSLLRPGGRIAVISNDFEFHERTWPPVPELDDLYDAYCDSRRSDGGDPCIGRRMPALLHEAGFDVVGFETETAHSNIIGDRAFLMAEGAGIPAQLVQDGFLSEDAFERLVESWRNMLEHPNHAIMRPLFVGVGENPVNGSATEPRSLQAGVEPAMVIADLEYVAPTKDLEREIAGIWAATIGVDRVGITNNFFDLGGNSLMLEQVQIELEAALDTELPLTTLFQHPTVAALAAHVGQPSAPPSAPKEPGAVDPEQAAPSHEATPEGAASIAPSADQISARAHRRRNAAPRRRR
jgi:ubiquinone/menaquinone biosynthesis C-methylase UbiE/acyl carrier protein